MVDESVSECQPLFRSSTFHIMGRLVEANDMSWHWTTHSPVPSILMAVQSPHSITTAVKAMTLNEAQARPSDGDRQMVETMVL